MNILNSRWDITVQKSAKLLVIAALFVMSASALLAQTPTPSPAAQVTGVIGEVKAIDAATRGLDDAGRTGCGRGDRPGAAMHEPRRTMPPRTRIHGRKKAFGRLPEPLSIPRVSFRPRDYLGPIFGAAALERYRGMRRLQ